MGVLLDDQYWIKKINDIYDAIDDDQEKASIAAVKIACAALRELVQDPELSSDIDQIAQDIPAENLDSLKGSDLFYDFIDTLVFHERTLLLNSGVKADAAESALEDLRSSAVEEGVSNSLTDLADKIRHCQRLICDLGDNKRDRVWKAIAGVATISIDVAAAGGAAAITITSGGAGAAAGASVGVLAGISAGYGATMIQSAIKGRW